MLSVLTVIVVCKCKCWPVNNKNYSATAQSYVLWLHFAIFYINKTNIAVYKKNIQKFEISYHQSHANNVYHDMFSFNVASNYLQNVHFVYFKWKANFKNKILQ